ncbi:hypothetical protein [Hyalangium minutum]|nr:hypothetical protein [Hyalangium minutum]
MLKPHYILLLVSLLSDGGTEVPRPPQTGADGGIATEQGRDAGGIGGGASSGTVLDGGIRARRPVIAGGIRWPEDVKVLTTLDAPAIVAAHAALQHLLARFAKEGESGCGYSPKGLELIVGEGDGLYLVRIEQRMDKCGWKVPPGFSTEMDWFELYAVSPEGKVLARYPYSP